MAGTAYRFRPREIRRLIESVEVVSCADGTLKVLPKWKPPAGGLLTRTRVAIWLCDLVNDELHGRRAVPDALLPAHEGER
jgi:hypothetical protein